MDPRAREYRQGIDRIDAGRRMATTLLQRCDVGIPVEAAIRELAPNLSDAAVDAARRLAGLVAFDSACLAMVLAGLADDALLEGAEIPEPPARAVRRTPDEIATDWLLRDLAAPPATVAEADPAVTVFYTVAGPSARGRTEGVAMAGPLGGHDISSTGTGGGLPALY